MSEHDFEAIRGLPGQLPQGETLLWQGSPKWTLLATQAFHIRAIAAYFGVMLIWRAASAINDGTAPQAAAAQALSGAPLAVVGLLLIAGLAWLNARTTVYSITSKRVVMRFGVALPKAINIPFTIIESAALQQQSGGPGDLALTLAAPNKIAFLHLWPHARPLKFSTPQPTLRGLADVGEAARILTAAMREQVQIETARPAAAPIKLEPAAAAA